MLISLNWLKDFVNIPKAVSAEELGLLLTTHTVEIERIEKQAEKFKNVVVGKILEIKKHPNADRLRLAKVDVGKRKLDIVCGAPNIEVGQKVPVALVGAVLPASPAGGPNGMEIKEVEVRGEKSCGMLCAEDELGLGEDHSGIMILDKKAKVGENLGEYTLG
jgi:phenylalanyl-tRNA synthetase beta chain